MDDMLTCPYNRSHVVSKLRMAQHLVKCEANNPHIILSTCYYDFLHRVPPEKLNEHLENCPSKDKFKTHFCVGEKPPGETMETGETAETTKTADTADTAETTKTAEAGETSEASDPTKNIYLKSSTSDYKESLKHTMQSASPAKDTSDTAQPATPVKDTSKGAIPKTTRPTYRYRHGSRGPSSSDIQSGGKGRGWSKRRMDSWDTDSSDEAE